MSSDQSGTVNTPIEPTTTNNDDTVSLDQIISLGQITTSQASIHLNTTNMIPSQVPTVSEILRAEFMGRRREARRRQRQRRSQQRQRRSTSTRRALRAQRYEQILNEQHTRWCEEFRERQRRKAEERAHEDYLRSRSPTFDERVEETIQEQLLDVYEWEKMTSKQRWEQAQAREFEATLLWKS